MTRTCNAFNRFESQRTQGALSDQERRQWQEHLEQCAECGTQWLVQTELQQMVATMPLPELSGSFNTRWRECLRRKSEMPSLSPLARCLMWSYWSIAAIASIIILTQLERPIWMTDTVISRSVFALLLVTYLRLWVPIRWKRWTDRALHSFLE